MFLLVEYLWQEVSLDMRVYMAVCAAVLFVINVAWMEGGKDVHNNVRPG